MTVAKKQNPQLKGLLKELGVMEERLSDISDEFDNDAEDINDTLSSLDEMGSVVAEAVDREKLLRGKKRFEMLAKVLDRAAEAVEDAGFKVEDILGKDGTR